MTPRLGVLAATVAALLTLGTSAFADVADPKVTAQALFDQGRALVKLRKYAEACPKLAESLRIDAGIGTMLWLADCYENMGRTASAWTMFNVAAASAAQRKDPREKVARHRAADLVPRLTNLVIVLPEEAALPGIEVERDGARIAPVEIGVPIPLDPGIHTLSATAPGCERWSTPVDLPARADAISVIVPVLRSKDDSLIGRGATTLASSDAPKGEKEAPRESGSSWRQAGLVIAGAGLLAVGAGAILGLSAKAAYETSNESGHCVDDRCDAVGKDRRSSAFDLATGSTISFTTGAAAILTGVVLRFVVGPRRAALGPTIAPALGDGRRAVEVTGRF